MRRQVSSLWQYDEIIKHAPNSLRVVLGIKAASWISCRQLHKSLCNQECTSCGRFGPVLYLLTCSRACYLCIERKTCFFPMTVGHARKEFGLGQHEVNSLPSAITLPGVYADSENKWHKRIKLVDSTFAKQAGMVLHGSEREMQEYVIYILPESLLIHASHVQRETLRERSAYAAKLSAWEAQNRGDIPHDRHSRPRQPFLNAWIDGGIEDSRRFMCIVKFPWLDRTNHKVEWGLGCKGCTKKRKHANAGGDMAFRTRYTAKDLVEHIQWCPRSLGRFHKH